MNLPLILDISIGLIFIYLILSLLASEIQELVATLLQWRAKHLKKSIESLLSSGSEAQYDTEVKKARVLVKELYNDPLINTLNHEAKEIVETNFRQISKKLNNKKIANRGSAASYIPSETFATTLIQTLKLPELIRKASGSSGELKTDLNMILASYKQLKTAV